MNRIAATGRSTLVGDMTPTSIATLAAATAPIDRQHLARYTLGDRALENEVLALFAGQLPSLVEGLKTATTARERHVAAHTLKGSSRAIGAWKLATLAEAVEEAIRGRPDLPLGAEAIRGIEAAASGVMAYVAHEMLRA